MALYKGKYRVKSTRLKGWNYTQAGYYFVTICCKNRVCFLGDVIDKKMHLSLMGEIVAEEWRKTEHIRLNVALDEWIVMPNHVHGIVVIKNQPLNPSPENTNNNGVKTGHRPVSTKQLDPNSLGSIIGQFKSVCTKRIRKQGFRDFGWQSRFYDHIIRDEESLHKAREYILNNPLKWEFDNNNPANLYT